jgi:ATP-dependent Clp protease protease subunit
LKKYYALETNGSEADVYIFGDITSWEWFDSDVSSYTLSKELNELDTKVETINVHINSYGGEVSEGLAIYNMLRNHNAKVVTYCDGFACSIASVIFMAGDERIMNNASLLMIHNAWTCACGNANDFRKQADDLDVITQASIEAYKSGINITEDELKELLDAETWLLPADALEKGFATSIVGESATDKVAASARKALFTLVSQKQVEQPLAPVLESTEIDVDELAGKLYERITAEIKKQGEPEPPKENNTIKFFNAIIGRKE